VQPGDRLVCAFIEPLPVDREFKKWYLHVTIVAWFRLEDSSESLAEGFQKALTPIQPFEAKIGPEMKLRSKRHRGANQLETSYFTDIEPRVRIYLHKKRAWIVDETTKRRYPYRPHVTFQGDDRLHEGDSFYCDLLYIVEQKGDYKIIEAEVLL